MIKIGDVIKIKDKKIVAELQDLESKQKGMIVLTEALAQRIYENQLSSMRLIEKLYPELEKFHYAWSARSGIVEVKYGRKDN